MATTTLKRPERQYQCAALMLTVFEANPGVVMTRREIEALVNVSEFSESTRYRSLFVLMNTGHDIRMDSGEWEGRPSTYWMPST
jgi:hypothetical protein